MGYIERCKEKFPSKSAIAYMAALDVIEEQNPQVARHIIQELQDQRSKLKLIASENYSSLAVQLAMGNLLTDKYAEGVPGKRFYAGCENVDAIESLAIQEAKELFGADHAYVQPHSGIDANQVAFWAILVQRVQGKEVEKLGYKNIDELSREEYEQVRKKLMQQKVMGLSLGSGGHLTHGYRHNISAKMMQSVPYEVDPVTGLIDYFALQKQVEQEKPLIIIAGYSSYPRRINFAKMREIADSVGAVLLVDMAHFAGLVAGGVFQGEYHPLPFAHMVTSTTHKTLRGPRGGFVLCSSEFQEVVDKGCPLVLGGPLPHVLAAKAIAFAEARRPAFQSYAQQIIKNSQALAQVLLQKGLRLTTGGTDNHLCVVDVQSSFGLTGRQAETALSSCLLTLNRNAIPFDPNGPWYTSGIRMGVPAVTTLGMKEAEMQEIADILCRILQHSTPVSGNRSQVVIDPDEQQKAKRRVGDLLSRFPLYPELVIQ